METPKQRNRRIARELAKSFRSAITASAEVAPDDWDGIELRQLGVEIAEGFQPGQALTGERKRFYRAACLDLNLPRWR